MHLATRRPGLILPIVLSAFAPLWACGLVEAQVRAEIRAEAVAGEPFGVGRVEVVLPESMLPEPLGLAGLGLSAEGGRVLYPVVDYPELGAAVLKEVKGVVDQSERPLGKLLSELLKPLPRARVYFLFRGSEPLELTLQSQRAERFRLTPRADSAAHARLMGLWWQKLTTRPVLLEVIRSPEHPPQVENYVQSMLARRLGLGLSQQPLERPLRDLFEQDLGLFTGTESMALAFQRDRMLGRTALDQPADQPLPEPLSVSELTIPDPPADVKIEALAMRVPAECFYLRFGSFANFLWFQDTLGLWQNDLRNLIASRGLNYQVRQRIEESLAMELSVLARLLGDATVADVAIVGTDLFFTEGGAYGLLYHARNNVMLAAEFARQRKERLARGGVKEEKVAIGDREVSLLASPDGSVRSYYAADGDFHFVTRSRTLMKRFLQTGSGGGSLGQSKDFRYARSLMPLTRGDTVFIYFSDAFFRNFVSPRYRIETIRRMQAAADLQLVELARLASAAEGKPGDTIEELVAGGFLPAGFGVRPDGSRAVLDGGKVYDSLRGRRGAMLPVPDIELTRVSPAEAAAYRQFGEFYYGRWRRLDPVLIGLKRQSLEGGRERVVIDARISPLDKENYQRLCQRFGPPEPTRLAPLLDDGVALEMVLTNQRVFGGLQQIHPPSADWIDYGLWRGIRDLFVGYVGTTGELGVLAPLNARIVGPPDERGFASAPGGMWRRDYGPFTLFSLQPDVLALVAPQLRIEPAERPAQVRLRVEDVTRAVIYPKLNNMAYARTRDTTLGNLRLLHELSQQLHVPGENCRTAAELLLDAKLVCPLGGEYVFRAEPGEAGRWATTALKGRPTGGLLSSQAPEGFAAPPLSWFRGLSAELTATPEALAIHAELVMELPAK